MTTEKCKLEHVILDIDKTLILSRMNIESEEIEDLKFRPYLKEFFIFLFENFTTVNIWSAGGKEYVDEIVEHFKKMIGENSFGFVYCGQKCDFVLKPIERGVYSSEYCDEQVKIKDLNVVFLEYNKLNKFNTMIIDDKKITFHRNYGNAIHMREFNGNEDDVYLKKVAEKLYEIKSKSLNFRNWKNREVHWGQKVSEEFLKIWKKL